MEYTYIDIDFELNSSYEVLDFLQNNLQKYGMSLASFSGMTFSTDLIRKHLAFCPTNLVFVRLSNNVEYNLQLKNVLCECFNSFLVKNTACSFAIESYLRLYKGSVIAPKDFENESLMVDGAEPLTSDKGFVQGYMLNFKDVNFCFLPPNLEQIEDVVVNRLPVILSKLYRLPTEFIYLKAFGINEDVVEKLLTPFVNNSLGVVLTYSTKYLDTVVSIGYHKNLDSVELDNYVAQVCESLKKYLYATDNISIEETALDMIRMTNKKIAMLESITQGEIYSKLANVDGKCVHDNFVYHKVLTEPQDIMDLASLNKELIATQGLYSVDSTYEITTAIIADIISDIAICTIADYIPSSKTVNCFLSIGDIDGVHIYKNAFKGELKDVKKIIIKNTCFYIIKKLKQNNLLFDQTLTNM